MNISQIPAGQDARLYGRRDARRYNAVHPDAVKF